jgi:TonB family protein
MKIMVRNIFTILLSSVVISIYAQPIYSPYQNKNADKNKEADKLYDRGVVAFCNNELDLSEELFKQSQSIKPANDIIYYLALIRKMKGDLCGYCNYAITGKWVNESPLSKLLVNECEKKDSVFYPSVDSSVSYSLITTFRPCTGETEGFYYIKDKDKNVRRAFYIIPADSISDTIYRTKFPDEEELRHRLVYLATETPPSFIGGEQAIYRTLAKYMVYPDEAKEKGIQGRVMVQFIITEDGHITGVHALNGYLKCLADAAVKAVMATNTQWIPGKINNMPVKTQMRIPLKFTLQSFSP